MRRYFSVNVLIDPLMMYLETLFLILYCIAAGILALYGLNCHINIHLFKRHLRQRPDHDRRLRENFYKNHQDSDLPVVTSQLPIYNELNVAERIIDAVVAFDYPQGKHEIQVLDDSIDETSDIIAQKVKTLQAQGIWIEHVRRPHRQGFKAGALKYGLEQAHGEFLSVFDADFVPPPDFLLKSIPFFLIQPNVGLIQGRWGHLNQRESFMTWFQSIGIDGHFTVEQSARNWNDLFMNFNGTAGIFRKRAVQDVGNWKADTLTEDLDLSYRLQLGGWKCHYLIDLVAPAEIPANIHAFKSQQFRWAKGSIQTAMKLLPTIWKSQHHFFKKLAATLHLTHYMVHPLMAYLAIASPFLLMNDHFEVPILTLVVFGSLLFISFIGPTRLYLTAGNYLYGKTWWRQVAFLPLLICFGCGMAINNTRAVFEAFIGRESEFIRTPKQGNLEKKRYNPRINLSFIFELLAGIWCSIGMVLYFASRQYLVGHFMMIYAIGFLYIGSLSLLYQFRRTR